MKEKRDDTSTVFDYSFAPAKHLPLSIIPYYSKDAKIIRSEKIIKYHDSEYDENIIEYIDIDSVRRFTPICMENVIQQYLDHLKIEHTHQKMREKSIEMMKEARERYERRLSGIYSEKDKSWGIDKQSDQAIEKVQERQDEVLEPIWPTNPFRKDRGRPERNLDDKAFFYSQRVIDRAAFMGQDVLVMRYGTYLPAFCPRCGRPLKEDYVFDKTERYLILKCPKASEELSKRGVAHLFGCGYIYTDVSRQWDYLVGLDTLPDIAKVVIQEEKKNAE